MLRKSKEELLDATHKDLIMLVKEYARRGYVQTRGSLSDEFEIFWRETFHLTEGDSVCQTLPQCIHFPRPAPRSLLPPLKACVIASCVESRTAVQTV